MSAAEALAGAEQAGKVLSLLARLLPYLITVEMGESDPAEEPWVFAYSIRRRPIWWGGDIPIWANDGEDRLQGALQRELEARGWKWEVASARSGYRGVVWRGPLYFSVEPASAPAVALSLALAQALAEGEG